MLTLKRPKVNQFTGCFFLKGLFKIDRLLFIFAMRKDFKHQGMYGEEKFIFFYSDEICRVFENFSFNLD